MNLLTDSLLRIDGPDGMRRVSLPELLEVLGLSRITSYPGMQRHQEDAFHVFLCSLAAAVLARHGLEEPVQTAAFWKAGLQDLAPTVGLAAWDLLGVDASKPAFMQPPLPKDDHAKLATKATSPDALDVLVTAKNHELKPGRASMPDIDEWVYALVSYQTMSGYLGNGNPGISRMNSGFGSRLVMEVVRTLEPGGRWRDAVARLLVHRRQVLQEEYGYDSHGIVLVWTEVWDGKRSLPLTALDPCYVEVCRRVRLRGSSQVDGADAVPSSVNRIDAKAFSGAVGDAWLPIDLSGATEGSAGGLKAVTIGPSGLTAEILRRLVFGDHVGRTALHRPMDGWHGELWLSVSVLVRGQGVTEGFHEQRIPLPARVKPRLFGPPAVHDPWTTLSKQLIEAAGRMQSALHAAVRSFLDAGVNRSRERNGSEPWWTRWQLQYQRLWFDQYFLYLWGVPDNFRTEEVLEKWGKELWNMAEYTLEDAMRSLPQHASRRYHARVQAQSTLWISAIRSFPHLLKMRSNHEEVMASDQSTAGR